MSAYGSQKRISHDGGVGHLASLGVVVRDGEVHRRALVPDRDVADRPLVAHLEIRVLAVLVEELEERVALGQR